MKYIELLGGMNALWAFFLEWLGVVIFGLVATFLLFRRHRWWPVAIFLSSALYLWAVRFPVYVSQFFLNLESIEQLPRRFQLLALGLSDVTLLHLQFLSPLFFIVAAIYAAVSFIRSLRNDVPNVPASGI